MISVEADRMTDFLVGASVAFGRSNDPHFQEKIGEAVTQLHDYIASLESKLAARDALIEKLVEAGEKACRDYEGFGYGIDNIFLTDKYIKPKSLPLEFSQDEFEDIVSEWQAMKGGEG